MLAPPKKVGIRPSGASLRCPFSVRPTQQIAPDCLSALRADVTCRASLVTPAFILPFLRTLCVALALDILLKSGEPKLGAVRDRSVTGRLGDFPASRRFSALLLKFQRTKPFLATTAQKLPDTAFRVYGCHPICRMGTNHLTTRNKCIYGFELWFGLRPATVGRENPTEKQGIVLRFSKFFRDIARETRCLSLITAAQFFPCRLFQN